jgi:hypothetical protein
MGGSSKSQTVANKYYNGQLHILCRGPIDKINRIKVDDKTVLSGSLIDGSYYIDKANIFGGESREGGISGQIDVALGYPTQLQNEYLLEKIGSFLPAFRGMVTTVLRQVYIGLSPYPKQWSYELTSIHVRGYGVAQWYDEKAEINYDIADRWEFVRTVDFSAYSSYSLGTQHFEGVEISGLSSADTIRITKVLNSEGGQYIAWSPHDDIEQWWERVTVKKNNGSGDTYTNFFTTQYSTPAAAEAASIGQEAIISGADYFAVGIRDAPWDDNRGGLSVKIERLVSQPDMNPIHICRDAFTDIDYGMGNPEAKCNDAQLMEAADICYDEKWGMSIWWDEESTTGEEFITKVCKHINAVPRINTNTGLFEIKLLRKDYEVSTLLHLDESKIIDVIEYSKAAYEDLTNSVTVNYWDSALDQNSTITIPNNAMIAEQGKSNPITLTYEGFSNSKTASKAALRDLAAMSAGPRSCTIITKNSAARTLQLGDVFKVTWSPYGLSQTIMRVVTINRGNAKNRKITINCSEDVYSMPEYGVIAEPEIIGEPVIELPTPVAKSIVFEVPYLEAVQQLGQSVVDGNLETNSSIGYVGTAAARPAFALTARMYTDSGAGYVEQSSLDFCPYAVLNSAIAKNNIASTINFDVTNSNELDLVEPGTWFQINNELFEFVSISTNTITAKRALLDTLPQSHSIGSDLYFWDLYLATDSTQYVEGEIISVKLQTTSGTGILNLDAASAKQVTLNGRMNKPYPPGNLKVNGVYFPATMSSSAGLNLTWSHRDRIQQTGSNYIDFTESSIGPELGVTYTLQIYNQFNTLIKTHTLLAGEGYNYTTTEEQADNGGGGGSSMVVEPYWSKTPLLLNFNGSNGSTTFTNSAGNYANVVGGAKIDTSQFKFGGASVLFDGNNDYLTDSISSSIGTGDFTIEFWVRREGDAAVGATFTQTLIDFRTAEPSVQILIDIAGSSSSYTFGFWVNGAYRIQGSSATLNTWFQIVLVRTSGVTKMYINGSQIGSNYTDANSYSSLNFTIGGRFASLSGDFRSLNGHMDDLRITKASRYSSAPAVQTIQYEKYVKDSNWSDNKLALIFEGENNSTTILDRSDLAQAVSVFGNAKISTTQFKFGTSALNLDGGSNSFIKVPFNAAYTGVSDLTFEGYIYTSDVTRSGTIACTTLLSSAGTRAGWLFAMDNTARLLAQGWDNSGALAFNIYPSNTLSVNTWYHVALVRNSGTWAIYLNGTSIGNAVESAALGLSGDGLYIGRDQWDLITWLGYMDDIRVRAFAAYTSSFSVPITSFLPIDSFWSNVLTLYNFNGANNSVEIENTAEFTKTLPATGNAQISTAQFKFGGASGLFDGSGDYLTIAYSPKYDPGSGDFTIEFWMRPSDVSSGHTIFDWRDATLPKGIVITQPTANPNKIRFAVGDSSTSAFEVDITSSGTIVANTFYFISVVRNGSTWTLYIDGVSQGSATSSFTPYINGANILIGVDRSLGTAYNGYLDDFRYTKFARYTASPFTIPSIEFSKYISALNTQLRFTLKAVRDTEESLFEYDHTVVRV